MRVAMVIIFIQQNQCNMNKTQRVGELKRKMPVFIDDMINHIENLGKSMVIQVVREFSMVNCYIIKIQKVL